MLAGKAVVVTGSGRGLGRAYPLEIARAGGAVVVNDVDLNFAEQVRDEIIGAGGRAIASGASVASAVEAESLIQCCVDAFGKIDGLVNNAGLVSVFAPEAEPVDRIKALVEVNLLGVIYCGHAAIRQMRRQNSGVIVNVTSGSSLGQASVPTYGATKGGVSTLVYNWAIDLEGTPIRVNGFSPLALTRMADHFPSGGRDLRPNINGPEEMGPVVAYLLSDDAAHLHGGILRVSTGGALSFIEPPSSGRVINANAHWTQSTLRDALANATVPRARLPAGGVAK